MVGALNYMVLLFVLYINDLPTNLKSSSAYLFADDTKIFKHIRSPLDIHLLQEDLNILLEWCEQNLLSFNIRKCHLLRLSNGCEHPIDTKYSLGGNSIITSHDECKDLGVIFSSDHSWSAHYNNILQKAYCQLGLIRRTFSLEIPTHVKKTTVLIISKIKTNLLFTSLATTLY